MDIVIRQSRPQLGSFAASRAAEILGQTLSRQPSARLVVATGSSQFEMLEALIQMVGIDWPRIDGFHLDEYIGLDRAHRASFCKYLEDRFVSRVPVRSFHFLDGSLNPTEVCRRANQAISEAAVDLALIGIGENGHLAFNDPPADFDTELPYIIVRLDEACRRQQVGEGWFEALQQVPTQAISMSIRQILSAKHIICCVPDQRKAEAVARAIEGPVTPQTPASILQNHPSVTMILDDASASQLSAATKSRARQNNDRQ